MGPQPIMPAKTKPPEMLATVERVLSLLLEGNERGLAAIADDGARAEIKSIADALRGRGYNGSEIVGVARTANHYWIKARLTGPDLQGLAIQFRLGEEDGRWTIRYAADLTGKRSGWTK
jgi:hypothetical protein